jgi:hypothetical protein
MDGLAVLAQARAAGLQVSSDGVTLTVRGPQSAELLAKQVLARKPEVIALLASHDHEVAWRVRVMRPQVPPRGPIRRLLARPDTPLLDAPRHCGSCGEALAEGRRYVCLLCQHAAWLVLLEVREGVSPEETPRSKDAD